MVFLKDFFRNVDFEKFSRQQKKHKQITESFHWDQNNGKRLLMTAINKDHSCTNQLVNNVESTIIGDCFQHVNRLHSKHMVFRGYWSPAKVHKLVVSEHIHATMIIHDRETVSI